MPRGSSHADAEAPTNPFAIVAAPRLTGPTIPGRTAQLRADGTAVPPAAAPLAVKRMIWTANRLIGRRYRYGGGHRAVSYALHAGALLDWPMVSGASRSGATPVRGAG